MRRALRTPLAVVFTVFVVTAGALGPVAVRNDGAMTLDKASDQFVQCGEGGTLLVTATFRLILGDRASVQLVLWLVNWMCR